MHTLCYIKSERLYIRITCDTLKKRDTAYMNMMERVNTVAVCLSHSHRMTPAGASLVSIGEANGLTYHYRGPN